MLKNSRLAFAIIPLGLVLIVAGLSLGRSTHGHLFGTSVDLLSGLIMGAGAGLVLVSIATGVGIRRT